MLVQVALYLATILGAVGVALMMPRGDGRRLGLVGALVGAAALGGLWLVLAPYLLQRPLGFDGGAMVFYYVFSFVAIAAAVRVITHTRPVYSALWFVMVVIASAGLFLTLSAEFMAFAMIIIYGGAILVTYMFVIMLASEPESEASDDNRPEYDRLAREPIAAVIAGFLLLAVLLSVAFEPMAPNAEAAGAADAVLIDTMLGERAVEPREISEAMPAPAGYDEDRLSNVERIGIDLFTGHPLAIELAGVILLVSLIGAIVIARTHVEDEDDWIEPDPEAPAGPDVEQPAEPGPHKPESLGTPEIGPSLG
jgi:NADH-quinone oxidoreductase subunit J